MPKVVVGPINKGLKSDRLPFNIDNDSFPTLLNAYQWRGRIKRKRGTELIGRLTNVLNAVSFGNISAGGAGTFTFNILSGIGATTLAPNASIVPGNSTNITITIAAPISQSLTDTAGTGTMTVVGAGPITAASLNYSTGVLSVTFSGAAAASAATITGAYYPNLPVMGIEDFVTSSNQYPTNIGFNTVYSYTILNTIPATIYNNNYYKNPAADPTALPGYVPKSTWTAITWNGQDYQQFWSTNYQGAFWETNGITVSYSSANVGMQFNSISNVTNIVAGPPATAKLSISSHGLSVGDFLFINEVGGVTGINFQTGYVITVNDANNVTVEFPNATLGGAYTSGGIAQYLTNNSNATKDCLRWFDGDPVGSNGVFTQGNGWVNFCPPLSENLFSIADLPLAKYYLVGARLITPYKDRLLFLGPIVQTSTGNPIYLQDTIIYSLNGTPFYTASFTGDPALVTTTFNPILVPRNQTAVPYAYWEDATGFGGFITSGIDQPITTVGNNQDTLIVGFSTNQTKLVYTGNDLIPFNFYSVNSELGSGSPFSSIIMDQGVLSRGSRGYLVTSQTGASRIDLEIPDEVFEIGLANNGAERVSAVRDYINEWVYFSFPGNEYTTYSDGTSYKFNTQTLLYNYRDESWGLFNENYTTYGYFRPTTGWTWGTIGQKYATWSVWNDSWGSGQSSTLQIQVMAGNQQGFLLLKSNGTGEANSIYIQNITSTTVTSPNHCLNEGDYIVINNCQGTIGSNVNGKIFTVQQPTQNSFRIAPTVTTGTYLGGGTIQRMYVPFIQSRQFPVAWEMGRKTRLGPQQYLLSSTTKGQMTLLIFLSQNTVGSPEVANNIDNDSTVFSTVLYTCPEATNLGLTPANQNLQMANYPDQNQIWHRVNTSLIGDTVQVGFWLNDTQMKDEAFNNQFAEIEIHGIIMDVNPSQVLA